MSDPTTFPPAGDSGAGRPVRTFSGAHPYRPQCAIKAARAIAAGWQDSEGYGSTDPAMRAVADEIALNVAVHITTAINADTCPRCSGPLHPDPVPEGWRPAGTRALDCRCVPVCETCANWVEPYRGPLVVTLWPTSELERDDEHATEAEFEAEFVERVKAKVTTATALVEQGSDGPVLVTDSGVAEVRMRPNPGGWLEHGYDDSDDTREAQQ